MIMTTIRCMVSHACCCCLARSSFAYLFVSAGEDAQTSSLDAVDDSNNISDDDDYLLEGELERDNDLYIALIEWGKDLADIELAHGETADGKKKKKPTKADVSRTKAAANDKRKIDVAIFSHWAREQPLVPNIENVEDLLDVIAQVAVFRLPKVNAEEFKSEPRRLARAKLKRKASKGFENALDEIEDSAWTREPYMTRRKSTASLASSLNTLDYDYDDDIPEDIKDSSHLSDGASIASSSRMSLTEDY